MSWQCVWAGIYRTALLAVVLSDSYEVAGDCCLRFSAVFETAEHGQCPRGESIAGLLHT